MDDQPELVSDDLYGASVEIIRPGGFDLAGRVISLAAIFIGKHVVGGGQRTERFDRSPAVRV